MLLVRVTLHPQVVQHNTVLVQYLVLSVHKVIQDMMLDQDQDQELMQTHLYPSVITITIIIIIIINYISTLHGSMCGSILQPVFGLSLSCSDLRLSST